MTFFTLSKELDEDGEFTLEYLESDGDVIKTFTNKKDKKSSEPTAETKKGMNRFVWNMRYPDAKKVPGAVMWGGTHIGPKAVPGEYQVRMTVNGKSQIQSFKILKDPRISTTQADFQAQFDLLMEIRDRTSEINQKVITIRSIKSQVKTLADLMEKSGFENENIATAGKELSKQLSTIEEELIQVKSKSRQDPLNYPIKLDNKIAALVGVVSSVDAKPTSQSHQVLDDLVAQAESHYTQLDQVLNNDLLQFNEMISKAEIPAVMIGSEDPELIWPKER